MPNVNEATLGRVVEDSLHSSLANWRNEYAKGTPVADLFAWHVKTVGISIDVFGYGKANLTITVQALKDWQTEIYFTKLLTVNGEWFFE